MGSPPVRVLWMSCGLILANPAWAILDCSKAKTNVEKLLCSSQRAATADQEMALSFRTAFARTGDRAALLSDQKRWQEKVRDQCLDVSCLVQVHRERTSELEDIQR